MQREFEITDIILVNGTMQKPIKHSVKVSNIEKYRKEIKSEYEGYDIFFIYKEKL